MKRRSWRGGGYALAVQKPLRPSVLNGIDTHALGEIETLNAGMGEDRILASAALTAPIPARRFVSRRAREFGRT